MKNRKMMKKVVAATVTAILTAALAVSVFARPGGSFRKSVSFGSGNMSSTEQSTGIGERPEPPEGAEGGERPELPEGAEEGERPELPEGAEEGERPELPESEGGRQFESDEMGGRGGFLNADSIQEQIEALENEDEKASLLALLDEYKSALDAEREVLDSGERNEDKMEEARSVVKSARQALEEALADAGIEIPKDIRPNDRMGRQMPS